MGTTNTLKTYERQRKFQDLFVEIVFAKYTDRRGNLEFFAGLHNSVGPSLDPLSEFRWMSLPFNIKEIDIPWSAILTELVPEFESTLPRATNSYPRFKTTATRVEEGNRLMLNSEPTNNYVGYRSCFSKLELVGFSKQPCLCTQIF